MTLLAIGLVANANMSADGFAQLVGRAGLEAMTDGGRAAVQHAKVPMAPLEIKPARADVGVGQSVCIQFTHALPDALLDLTSRRDGSSAAAVGEVRVLDEGCRTALARAGVAKPARRRSG